MSSRTKIGKLTSKSGSPNGVDGGGAVSIDFDDKDYPPGADPDDHESAGSSQMKTLLITDASGNVLDLSQLVSSNPNLSRVKISHRNPGGTITTKGKPLGIHFSGNVFKQNQPGGPKATSYFN